MVKVTTEFVSIKVDSKVELEGKVIFTNIFMISRLIHLRERYQDNQKN